MADPVFAQEPINWNLISELAKKPHPGIVEEYVDAAMKAAEEYGLPYLGELVGENRISHLLLDMLGVPCPLPTQGGSGHASDLDARVWRAVAGALALQERLGRIADWHSRPQGPAGIFGDGCVECGYDWPCDTRRMAEGHGDDDAGADSAPSEATP